MSDWLLARSRLTSKVDPDRKALLQRSETELSLKSRKVSQVQGQIRFCFLPEAFFICINQLDRNDHVVPCN